MDAIRVDGVVRIHGAGGKFVFRFLKCDEQRIGLVIFEMQDTDTLLAGASHRRRAHEGLDVGVGVIGVDFERRVIVETEEAGYSALKLRVYRLHP